jgi:hypothetical protein
MKRRRNESSVRKKEKKRKKGKKEKKKPYIASASVGSGADPDRKGSLGQSRGNISWHFVVERSGQKKKNNWVA